VYQLDTTKSNPKMFCPEFENLCDIDYIATIEMTIETTIGFPIGLNIGMPICRSSTAAPRLSMGGSNGPPIGAMYTK
jgi:hypothetical protein